MKNYFFTISLLITIFYTNSVFATEYKNTKALSKVGVPASLYENCFEQECDGCNASEINFSSAHQRGERIIINARVKWKVRALLYSGNYDNTWRLEFRDDIDRFICIGGDTTN